VAAVVPLAGAVAPPAAAQDASPPACPATDEAENRAIVERWYTLIDEGNVAAFPEVIAPVVVQHAADFADARGVEAVQTNFAPFLAAFPDVAHDIQLMAADGDLVAARVAAKGTHTGEFMGIAPTGSDVTWTAKAIFRIECGRIAEHWSEVDSVGRLQQLGALSPLGSSAKGTPAVTPATAVADASPAACVATTEDENADLVRRWYDEVWSKGNDDHLDELIAPNHIHHRVLNRTTTGSAARVATIESWRVTMPDLVTSPDFLFTDGDLVVVRWTATGTQDGPGEDIPPTGNTVTWTGNTIFRIECGRIAEEWSEADSLAFFRQLGVVEWPSAGGSATPAP
jgi:steroid delta-isomerase-like uncharacterized protein